MICSLLAFTTTGDWRRADCRLTRCSNISIAAPRTRCSHVRRSLDAVKQMTSERRVRSDMPVTIFGDGLPMPMIVSPTARLGRSELRWRGPGGPGGKAPWHPDVRHATQSMTTMETCDMLPGANLWFSALCLRGPRADARTIRRAKALGIRTCFSPRILPVRPEGVELTRNGFGIPIKPTVRGAVDVLTYPRWMTSVLRYVLTTGVDLRPLPRNITTDPTPVLRLRTT